VKLDLFALLTADNDASMSVIARAVVSPRKDGIQRAFVRASDLITGRTVTRRIRRRH
jgi:hypothetical protein